MEHRTAELAQAFAAPAEGARGLLSLHQYELLFEMTTQLLAAQSLDEQTSLVLDTLTAGLGCASAAVALVERPRGVLRVRAAAGFADDEALAGLELPLDSNAPQVRIVHDGRPAWLARTDEAAAEFLRQLGAQTDVLALPLFGGHLHAEPRAAGETTTGGLRGEGTERFWLPQSLSTGALYVGARREELAGTRLDLLTRYADRIGAILSHTAHVERLSSSVRKLQRERQWVESIMKSVADPIVLTNMDNEILLQNRRAEELFSDRRDASEGKRRALEMNDLLFSAYLSSAAVASEEVVGRDLILVDPIEGADIHFEVISTPALNGRGERIGLVSIFRDVTDLRRANEELARNFVKLQQAESEARRERDRLDLILEHVGQPIAVCDTSGKFILFNQRAELLFQEREEMPWPALRAVRNNSVKLTSFISALASGAESGRQAEIELIDPETSNRLPMEITSAEVADAKGQVTAVVSVLHDLSEIRELERRRVEQQLFESEKLAAVGRLAASIAHEVNNPLEAIKNSLYLLTTGKDMEKNSKFLEVARKETERVSHIIRQMLGFARRSGEVEWVEPNQLIEETLILVEKKMKQARVEVVRHFDPQLPKIRARPDQLRQVFLNLLLNAQQAMEKGGRISVRTSVYEQALQPTVSVQISDTGRGISESDLARIFEPFFSTRSKGTGLGLWVTQDIVRHHGGRIEATSEEGVGTTFNVILPVDSPTLSEADGGKKL
ncbi:MAG: PAS domain S-box protein [Acidobacteria bacterium]|nr:PAS domain S-box protein [Acidobacteriota bacterium]